MFWKRKNKAPAPQEDFPEKVLEKIEKARSTGAKELNLSNYGLKKLPNSLWELTQLEKLILGSKWRGEAREPNQLSSLPKDIGKLKKLTLLDLKGNKLNNLPEEIGKLTQLAILDLRENQLKYLPESIDQLVQLTYLNLANNPLWRLPRNIHKLEQLTYLDLSGHHQYAIPNSIAKLKKLKTLLLNANRLLSLPKNVTKLPQLTVLDLSGNLLENLHESIAQLTQLKQLDLRENKLKSLPESIDRLIHLNILNLHGNNLSSLPESIGQLKQLSTLTLNENKLWNLPQSIGQLSQLTTLDLSWNKLNALPSSIGQITQLSILKLRGNKLSSLPKDFEKLIQLNTLDLKGNELTSLPENIGQLSQLEILDLTENKLTSLPESIGQLQQLKELPLSENRLRSLPESIGQLTQLTALNIVFHELTSLPESIGQLAQLTTLNLSVNQLSSLPESIGLLQKLTKLDLRGNKLVSLPESIGRLTQLTTLDLGENKLTSLPESISQLTQLTSLNLFRNQLSNLPHSISQLKRLTTLNLKRNQLSSLPESIGQLRQLEELSLSDNPLITPPLEIINQGVDAIRNYFDELTQSTVKLYETKMLLIGQGVVGKTSLKNKLLNKNFDVQLITEGDRTHGIEVNQWELNCDFNSESQEVTLNIWDFGGQEIYHATHQFFLTKRSLYVLMGDTTREDNQFKYWLNVVNLLGGDAPVLVVMNKVDLQHAQLDQIAYKNNFPQIENFHNTSLLTGVGMEDLKRQIQKSIAKLPHLGDEIPGRWLDVRRELEDDERNFIDYDDYLEICEEFEMDEERASFLIDYLHDLGVILHFKHNRFLRNYVILKPEWGTQAIYQVLDPKLAPKFMKEQLGHFVFEDLRKIWQERKIYKGQARNILLELMLTFELCFKLQDADTYIIPQLLPENPPQSADLSPFQATHKRLSFEYRYDFMPKGLMTRFICRIHKQIKDQSFWKSGVVLKFENSLAYIKHQFLQRKISIQLVGDDNKELLAIIRSHFAHIHGTLNNLKVNQMVPCICNECKGIEKPYFYNYQKLRRRLERLKLTVECEISYEDMDVRALLSGIQYEASTDKIQRMIAENSISEVFLELKKAQVDTDEIIMLENRWSRYQSNKRMGDQDPRNLEITYTQIVKAILELGKDSGEML